MAKRTTAELQAAAAALLTDSGPDYGILPSEHKALVDDLIDSRGPDVSQVGNVTTFTLPNGTEIVITVGAVRPSDAQYYALVTNGTTRPTAAQMTAGPDHRASNDGAIAGWPARQTNGYLWIWSSHTLTELRNGSGSQNQFDSLQAPTALTVNGTAGHLYRSGTILYPAALNLNWRVA